MPKRRPAPPPPSRADIGRAVVTYTPRTRQVLAEIAESARSATLDRPAQKVVLSEATTGGARVTKPGRVMARLIRAGWSLNSNHYGAAVLRRAAESGAFKAGTLCFADHATEEEDEARPAGSIANIAGWLVSDARWDETEQALMAEVRLSAQWREAIEDMADAIGMSIRAWVYGEHGEADGRSGFVVSDIAEGRSVDFVTVPAAGGGIVSILESVGNRVPTAEARNAGHWFEARMHSDFTGLADEMFGNGYLTREERITLSSAVGDGLAAFAARVEQDAPHLYERDPYQQPDPPMPAAADEAGQPATSPTAAAVTEDVTDGAPPAAPNPPNREDPDMGTQTGETAGEAGTATTEARTAANETPAEARLAILEAERNQLRDRANTSAEQLAEAQAAARQAAAQAAEAVAEMHRLRANEAGRVAVDRLLTADESGVPADMQGIIGPRVHAAILNNVPLTDGGDVNQEALEAAVTAAIRAERVHAAALLEAQGVGRVSGLGADGDPAMQMTGEQFAGGMASIFESIGMDKNVAALAAKGR